MPLRNKRHFCFATNDSNSIKRLLRRTLVLHFANELFLKHPGLNIFLLRVLVCFGLPSIIILFQGS